MVIRTIPFLFRVFIQAAVIDGGANANGGAYHCGVCAGGARPGIIVLLRDKRASSSSILLLTVKKDAAFNDLFHFLVFQLIKSPCEAVSGVC